MQLQKMKRITINLESINKSIDVSYCEIQNEQMKWGLQGKLLSNPYKVLPPTKNTIIFIPLYMFIHSIIVVTLHHMFTNDSYYLVVTTFN